MRGSSWLATWLPRAAPSTEGLVFGNQVATPGFTTRQEMSAGFMPPGNPVASKGGR